MKKAVLIFFAVVLLAVAAVFCLAWMMIDEDFIEKHAGEQLGDGLALNVTDASFNPLTRTIRLGEVHIFLQDGSGEDVLRVRNFRFEKIGVIAALRGNLSVQRAAADHFFINQRLLSGYRSENPGNGKAAGQESELYIGSLELENGDIIFAAGDDGQGEIRDFSFSAGPVHYSPDCTDCTALSALKNTEMKIGSVDYQFSEERYRLRINDIAINEPERTAELGDLMLAPVLEEDEFFESLEYRTEMFEVRMTGLHADTLDFDGLRNGDRYAASSVLLDSLNLHVTLDKRVQRGPDTGTPPFPLEVLNELSAEIALDRFSLQDGDIRYSEYHENGVRPGTIHFGGTRAQVSHIHNHSSDSTVFDIRSYVEDAGELNTRVSMHLQNGRNVVDVEGSLGQFNVTKLNNIFPDLAGVNIKSGMVYGLEFEYRMLDHQAEGTIAIRYDDFGMEMVDRVDRNQNFMDRVTGFFVDRISLRSSSENGGEDVRRGKIAQERDPDKSFFNYLWASLRSGIMDVIKRL